MVGVAMRAPRLWPHCLIAIAMAAALVSSGRLGQAVVAGSPEAAGGEDIARIETYLNGLDSVRADFVQINPDGRTVTGEFYYARPDKMRLDYDPPSEILIVANGWNLVYHDRRLQQVNYLYTNQTPLGFLLADEVRLSGEVSVTSIDRRGGELLVTLVQTEEPAEGAITLAFSEQPLELRRWTVVDPQGNVTHVVLEDLRTDVDLDKELFRFRDPRDSRPG
jgi:outer membrane lipoprotein-sorting protein